FRDGEPADAKPGAVSAPPQKYQGLHLPSELDGAVTVDSVEVHVGLALEFPQFAGGQRGERGAIGRGQERGQPRVAKQRTPGGGRAAAWDSRGPGPYRAGAWRERGRWTGSGSPPRRGEAPTWICRRRAVLRAQRSGDCAIRRRHEAGRDRGGARPWRSSC